MIECKKCGRTSPRDYCPYCVREARWDFEKNIKQFTPRIQSDLKSTNIGIPSNTLGKVRKPGGGLFLTGKSGSGKTLYASQVMLNSLKKTFVEQSGPRSHKFITVPDLLNEIRISFDSSIGIDVVQVFCDYDFLVLDDLGVEKITDWTLEKLYQIINHRYEYLKPTIYTSNLSLKDLSEKIGDRIPSRISTTCNIIKMKEIDYRLE